MADDKERVIMTVRSDFAAALKKHMDTSVAFTEALATVHQMTPKHATSRGELEKLEAGRRTMKALVDQHDQKRDSLGEPKTADEKADLAAIDAAIEAKKEQLAEAGNKCLAASELFNAGETVLRACNERVIHLKVEKEEAERAFQAVRARRLEVDPVYVALVASYSVPK